MLDLLVIGAGLTGLTAAIMPRRQAIGGRRHQRLERATLGGGHH